MTVCDFCLNSVFLDQEWQTDWPKTHHTDPKVWAGSIQESCSICELLMQHLQQDITLNKATEDLTRRLNWTLPVYQVRYLESTAVRGQYELVFSPIEEDVVPTSDSRSADSLYEYSLSTQSFLVYPHDGM